ncbi:unnamed protein product [Tetraodon nigroviridis]|uniref:(spotted green pufferfish) hypothetical protein n=1 Tax=Tetraodon nigroviridis TaxID=99883 RepID=Q4T1F0_TETNG|nr:unnamed protein product [Tetraodon nigroviridis]
MEFRELFFFSLGTAVFIYCAVKLLIFSKLLFPRFWFAVPYSFLTSMGEWAVVTGASEGIGRAYAFELAKRGVNVVIMSRTKEALDQVAREISKSTGREVKVIVTDFVKEDVFGEIEDQLRELKIGILVNNVGILPNYIPSKFLDSADLDLDITRVINCNVRTTVKMCKMILPGMVNREKGLILNISSGIASVPFPMYTLYAASKVFIERFSQGLQAEYKDKGIIIQAVAPFGVSTRMTAYQSTNMLTLSPEDFVQRSLLYLKAGDKTYGNIGHTIMGWVLQHIPLKLLYADATLSGLQNFVKKAVKKQDNT